MLSYNVFKLNKLNKIKLNIVFVIKSYKKRKLMNKYILLPISIKFPKLYLLVVINMFLKIKGVSKTFSLQKKTNPGHNGKKGEKKSEAVNLSVSYKMAIPFPFSIFLLVRFNKFIYQSKLQWINLH